MNQGIINRRKFLFLSCISTGLLFISNFEIKNKKQNIKNINKQQIVYFNDIDQKFTYGNFKQLIKYI